jgi:hypothetical protein
MGVGFTIDTPLKVSQFGIDSVLSIGDDILLERLRKMYSEKFKLPYKEISDKIDDFRAKRITSYLNLINKLAEKKIEELKKATSDKSSEIKEYFNMLPDSSSLKQEFKKLSEKYLNINELKGWLRDNLSMGSIDVNIMTKVDKENYANGEQLPVEYNDAHASLRGFANSDLSSSLILSAGMNPRLYGYMENFEDFYPNEDGEIKKRIVLKVSDYRSALIQGKFLAKKGLWVSEYRIESGLNCGGHAFATDGYLIGPILAEFKENRQELIDDVYAILLQGLQSKGKTIPSDKLGIKISAQGGVGTAEEHQFLLDYYEVDSVGWGSPFLLVPEVTNVDEITLEKLTKAKEDDLYLSHISPLGVPFNNLKGNTKDLEKSEFNEKGRPGSSCPKKFLALNKEFTDKAICTASRQYQHLKLKELEEMNVSPEKYKFEHDKIVDKSCICVGLGTPALLVNDLDTKVEGPGVSVCPGPNLAYFSSVMSLKEMNNHIYGKENVISRTDRPNMFVKELSIYINYLKDQIEEAKLSVTAKQKKYLSKFTNNLLSGVDYYQSLFENLSENFKSSKADIFEALKQDKKELNSYNSELEKLELVS